MSDLLNPAHIAHLRHLFHRHSPLVHCMTNDVVQTFTANVLLAIGASPAMVIDPDEASQFAAIADALADTGVEVCDPQGLLPLPEGSLFIARASGPTW